MDINKLGGLLDGYPPYSNLKEDFTVFIGTFDNVPYMVPTSYDKLYKSELESMEDSKAIRVCNEYLKISDDKNFYIINIGGNVFNANIENKIKLVTISSFTEENKYKYSLIDESGYKQLVVKKDDEEVARFSLEDKTILYLVEEINRSANIGTIDFYATTELNEDNDVNANTLSLVNETPFGFSNDISYDYNERIDEVLTRLSTTLVKHIGFVDGDFLKPYVDATGKKEYKYYDLMYFADFMADSGNYVTITIPYSPFVANSSQQEEIITEQTLGFHDNYTSDEVGGILSPFVNVLVADMNMYDSKNVEYRTNCVPTYVGLLAKAKYRNHHIKSFIEVRAKDNLLLIDDKIAKLSNKGFIPITYDRYNLNIHGNKNLIYKSYISNEFVIAGSEDITRMMSFTQNVLLVQDILRDLTKHFNKYFETATKSIFSRHPIGANSEIKKQTDEIVNKYKNSISAFYTTVDYDLSDNTFTSVDYKISIELIIAGEISSMTISTTVR